MGLATKPNPKRKLLPYAEREKPLKKKKALLLYSIIFHRPVLESLMIFQAVTWL